MTANNRRKGSKRGRRVSVRSVRRSNVDAQRLSRALIGYALKAAADEAAAQAAAMKRGDDPTEAPHD